MLFLGVIIISGIVLLRTKTDPGLSAVEGLCRIIIKILNNLFKIWSFSYLSNQIMAIQILGILWFHLKIVLGEENLIFQWDLPVILASCTEIKSGSAKGFIDDLKILIDWSFKHIKINLYLNSDIALVWLNSNSLLKCA